MAAKGHTEPRLWTPPLRELTSATSNGDAFIVFCRQVLGVELYPWQKWLVRHALELDEDGTYRYERILVEVGRQNGKTFIVSALSCFWLFVEAFEEPGRSPDEFKVVGVAQNLKTAALPYEWVVSRCDPKPPGRDEAARVIPALGAQTARVVRARGSEEIITRAGAKYQIREASAARGQPASRVLLDELREHRSWENWAALLPTISSFANGQIWCITNAGNAQSVVLNHLRGEAMTQVELAARYGENYLDAEGADPTIGFFEWSAPEDAKPLDEDAILAANPSIGYSGLSVRKCRSKFSSMPEAKYRAEVLCQYVPAQTSPYIDPKAFESCVVEADEWTVAPGERTVWAVDTSADRRYTSVAAAVMCTDGVPLVALVRDPEMGMLHVPDVIEQLARESGQHEVMLQERGCPAMEFRQPLEDRGLQVRPVSGSWFGIATGRMRDAVRERRVRFVRQEQLEMAVAGGVTRRYGETDAWDRRASAVDIAPLVACSLALYGLENPVDVPLSAYESRGLMTV